MGITHCVVKAAPELTGLPPPWQPGVLEKIQSELRDEGLTLIGLEGDPFDMSRIKLGKPGREEDLEHYRKLLREMGRLGLRLLCYNFMAGTGWHRTDTGVAGRGGATVTGFDAASFPAGATSDGEVSTEFIWQNYETFLSAILPTAVETGVKLGAHPDDPPIPFLRGIGRIFNTPAQFDRVLALSTATQHGLTFCQANWKLMCGGNEARLVIQAHRHTTEGRVQFVHLRHVTGTADRFVETFHDEGGRELGRLIQIYHSAGFRGPARSDHVPSLFGEDTTTHVAGYGTMGRLFANGYLLGLFDAHGVRTEPKDWLGT